GPLLLGLAEAEPVVAGRLLELLLPLTHLLEPRGRAVAVVRIALLEEPLDVRPVGVEPLALPVGRIRSADVRALVPAQPEPVQSVEDLPFAVLTEAGPVGVLDAQ